MVAVYRPAARVAYQAAAQRGRLVRSVPEPAPVATSVPTAVTWQRATLRSAMTRADLAATWSKR